MSRFLVKIFGRQKSSEHHASVSGFVRHASKNEKENLIREVVREANKDQRELIEEYEKVHATKV